jgi:hypothetical protein
MKKNIIKFNDNFGYLFISGGPRVTVALHNYLFLWLMCDTVESKEFSFIIVM